jgi:hypothetical protein
MLSVISFILAFGAVILTVKTWPGFKACLTFNWRFLMRTIRGTQSPAAWLWEQTADNLVFILGWIALALASVILNSIAIHNL